MEAIILYLCVNFSLAPMNNATTPALAGMIDMRFTVFQVRAGAAVVAAAMLGVMMVQIIAAKDFVTPAGTPVGGDFIAFWAAAKALTAGHLSEIYNTAFFQDWLGAVGPAQEQYALTWQYPPTYYFVIAPLALLPFGVGYALWTGGSLAIFAATCRALGARGAPLLIMLAAPVIFQGAITGQNSFLTASLMVGAGMLAGRRPMVAGLCAALLTVKPQLGLLIPIAFMAGGHWRAFGWAAAGSVALAGGALAAFGAAPWIAFFESANVAAGGIGSGQMPLFKMPTIFSAAFMAGAPSWLALGAHGAGALAAICAIVYYWRKNISPEIKTALLCAGTFFVSPYAFYYEFVILAAPITLIAMRARRQGWAPFEPAMLAGLFLLPMMLPGDPVRAGFNLGFVVSALAAVYVLRKAREETFAQQAKMDGAPS